MTEKLPAERPMKVVLACALSFLIPLAAAEKPADTDPAESSATAAPANTSSSSEMEQLKRMLLDQQRQIDELRRALAERKPSDTSLAEGNPATPAHPSTGEVASTRPVVPPAPSPSPTPSPVWAFNPPAL